VVNAPDRSKRCALCAVVCGPSSRHPADLAAALATGYVQVEQDGVKLRVRGRFMEGAGRKSASQEKYMQEEEEEEKES